MSNTASNTAVIADLPAPGVVVIRHGEPYVLCAPCGGNGEATLPGDPFCTSCMGSGVEPLLDSARRAFHAHGGTATEQAIELLSQPLSGPNFTSGSTPGVKMCSDAQLKFIKDLARQTGITHTEGGKMIAELTTSTPGFTSRRASEVIDFLKGQPKISEASSPEVRRNRMDQDCAECGQNVPANAGILSRENDRWVVRHDGACPKVMSEEDREINRLVIKHDLADPAIDLSGVIDGRYGDYTDLTSDLKLRISRNDEETIVYVHDAAFYGFGQEYGAQLPGETYRGKVADHLRAIVANPIAAAARYGQMTSSCGICGRTLEDNKHKGPDGLTSLERGIGPVCFQKLGGGF